MYQARTHRWPRRFSIAICVAALAGAEAQPPALDQEIALVTPKAESASIDAEAMGAIAPCAVCHGSNGEGNPALDTPRIAGLDAQYLARQLEYFRMSVRGATDEDKYGTQMRAIALTLKEQEVAADLATYFSTLEPPYAAMQTIKGDTARGAQLYMVCSACHGTDGRGSHELHTPSLVGQDDSYIARQLEHFRTGLRGANPFDVYGRQMAPIARATLMSEQDVRDVTAYISTLSPVSGAPPSQASGARVLGRTSD